MRYRFFPDTNQAHFEDALWRAGLAFTSPSLSIVELEDDPPIWVEDLARELGAEFVVVEEAR